jgi:hypothetical protein
MNMRERITAAAGSITLNVLVLLVLGQAAGAATPSAMKPVEQPERVVAVQTADQTKAQAHCESRLRTRALVAVILGMIV